jgi:hypothetical protein
MRTRFSETPADESYRMRAVDRIAGDFDRSALPSARRRCEGHRNLASPVRRQCVPDRAAGRRRDDRKVPASTYRHLVDHQRTAVKVSINYQDGPNR